MKPIRLLSRAVSVLKSFTPREPELTAAEIQQKAKIPKATAYRILANLTEAGLLERDGKTGRYRIGPELYLLGSLYLTTTDILRAAESVMETLNDLTSEAINLSIFERGNVVLVMKEESKHTFRIALHIGSVLPAYASSMGKAFLSELSEAEIDSLYPEERLQPLTKKTIATKSELKLQLQQIRKTGVSFSRGETYEGGEGVASLIRDTTGKAVAAMSISVPVFRMNQGNRERLATLIKLATSLVSFRLGYQDRACPVHDIQEIRSWWKQNHMESESPEWLTSLKR